MRGKTYILAHWKLVIVVLLKHRHFFDKNRILASFSEKGMILNLLSFDLWHCKCKIWSSIFDMSRKDIFYKILQRLIELN